MESYMFGPIPAVYLLLLQSFMTITVESSSTNQVREQRNEWTFYSEKE